MPEGHLETTHSIWWREKQRKKEAKKGKQKELKVKESRKRQQRSSKGRKKWTESKEPEESKTTNINETEEKKGRKDRTGQNLWKVKRTPGKERKQTRKNKTKGRSQRPKPKKSKKKSQKGRTNIMKWPRDYAMSIFPARRFSSFQWRNEGLMRRGHARRSHHPLNLSCHLHCLACIFRLNQRTQFLSLPYWLTCVNINIYKVQYHTIYCMNISYLSHAPCTSFQSMHCPRGFLYMCNIVQCNNDMETAKRMTDNSLGASSTFCLLNCRLSCTITSNLDRIRHVSTSFVWIPVSNPQESSCVLVQVACSCRPKSWVMRTCEEPTSSTKPFPLAFMESLSLLGQISSTSVTTSVAVLLLRLFSSSMPDSSGTGCVLVLGSSCLGASDFALLLLLLLFSSGMPDTSGTVSVLVPGSSCVGASDFALLLLLTLFSSGMPDPSGTVSVLVPGSSCVGASEFALLLLLLLFSSGMPVPSGTVSVLVPGSSCAGASDFALLLLLTLFSPDTRDPSGTVSVLMPGSSCLGASDFALLLLLTLFSSGMPVPSGTVSVLMPGSSCLGASDFALLLLLTLFSPDTRDPSGTVSVLMPGSSCLGASDFALLLLLTLFSSGMPVPSGTVSVLVPGSSCLGASDFALLLLLPLFSSGMPVPSGTVSVLMPGSSCAGASDFALLLLLTLFSSGMPVPTGTVSVLVPGSSCLGASDFALLLLLLLFSSGMPDPSGTDSVLMPGSSCLGASDFALLLLLPLFSSGMPDPSGTVSVLVPGSSCLGASDFALLLLLLLFSSGMPGCSDLLCFCHGFKACVCGTTLTSDAACCGTSATVVSRTSSLWRMRSNSWEVTLTEEATKRNFCCSNNSWAFRRCSFFLSSLSISKATKAPCSSWQVMHQAHSFRDWIFWHPWLFLAKTKSSDSNQIDLLNRGQIVPSCLDCITHELGTSSSKAGCCKRKFSSALLKRTSFALLVLGAFLVLLRVLDASAVTFGKWEKNHSIHLDTSH